MEETKITIAGKEIGLYYCIGASKDFASLAGGLDKIAVYLSSGDGADIQGKIEQVILIMNKWYCRMAACNGETAETITMEETDLFMDPNDTDVYAGAITKAIEIGARKMVKVKAVPSKNAKSGRKRSS